MYFESQMNKKVWVIGLVAVDVKTLLLNSAHEGFHYKIENSETAKKPSNFTSLVSLKKEYSCCGLDLLGFQSELERWVHVQ